MLNLPVNYVAIHQPRHGRHLGTEKGTEKVENPIKYGTYWQMQLCERSVHLFCELLI